MIQIFESETFKAVVFTLFLIVATIITLLRIYFDLQKFRNNLKPVDSIRIKINGQLFPGKFRHRSGHPNFVTIEYRSNQLRIEKLSNIYQP